MAKAVTSYADVFQLTTGPKALRPVIRALMRVVALADR
jgi:hypothetical protein